MKTLTANQKRLLIKEAVDVLREMDSTISMKTVKVMAEHLVNYNNKKLMEDKYESSCNDR